MRFAWKCALDQFLFVLFLVMTVVYSSSSLSATAAATAASSLAQSLVDGESSSKANSTVFASTKNSSLRTADLQSLIVSTEQILKSKLDDIEELQTQYTIIHELDEKLTSLSHLEEELIQRTLSLQDRIHHIHSLVANQFGKQLYETINRSLNNQNSKKTQQQPITTLTNNTTIAISDMKAILREDDILYPAEKTLKDWIRNLVQETVMNTRIAAFRRMATTQQQTRLSPKCITPSDGAQLLQQMLTENPILAMTLSPPPLNHFSTAKVIHEWTSDTYETPPTPQEKLGHDALRYYIPQDWETHLLPEGWEEWSVKLPNVLARSLGIKGTVTLPPEAFLDSNTHPGACWPMKGNRGYITLRLAQPIQFESVTLDHVVLSTSMNTLLQGQRPRGSAPRYLEIIGYPPSTTDSWGMDTTRGVVLVPKFEWDPWKSSSVTVPNKNLQRDAFVAKDKAHDMMVPPGMNYESCSEVKPACDAPPIPEDDHDSDKKYKTSMQGVNDENNDLVVVAGIKIQILGNWGNPDYTCLYHAKLHGSTV